MTFTCGDGDECQAPDSAPAGGGDRDQAGTDQPVGEAEQKVLDAVEEISGWWRDYSEYAIRRTAPKSVEYAGSDLDIMATGMLALLGDKIDGTPDVEAMRMGRYMAIQFYALGKVARSLGRLAHGEMPGEDNEFDLMVYAVMARRIRETGRWT